MSNPGDLLEFRSFGQTTLAEVRRQLQIRGLRLGQAHEEPSLPADWLTCTDLARMLEHFADHTSARKRRLFACACCRKMWDLLVDPCSRSAVELAERYADGAASLRELQEARPAAFQVTRIHRSAASHAAHYALVDYPDIAVRQASRCAADLGLWEVQCSWFRDLLAVPSDITRVSPSLLDWNGGAIRAIASTIYEERRFDEMPILADALEEAGCQDEAILAHCRNREEHIRGCWVIDLLTGRN
jgi:hypothetical protein